MALTFNEADELCRLGLGKSLRDCTAVEVDRVARAAARGLWKDLQPVLHGGQWPPDHRRGQVIENLAQIAGVDPAVIEDRIAALCTDTADD